MNIQFNPFPELESNRLFLKQLDQSHTSALFRYHSSKDNFPYVDMPIHQSVVETENYVTKMTTGVAENKWVIWAICLKESGEIIGTISIWNLDRRKNKGEFGYDIFPKYRRKGYMKETMNVVLKYAFGVMKMAKIEAYTNHENLASIEFLRNMGFTYCETIEDEYSNGKLMDVFEITGLKCN